MNKKSILVTGANGQLGMEFRALEECYPAFQFLFVTKEQLSITDSNAVEGYFSQNAFDYCINCAAYTAVDKAETESALAFEINARAAGSLAAVCSKNNVSFVHISTDYVFDGTGNIPYKEDDQVNPVNMYGSSKQEGEKLVLQHNSEAVIIRTSWVYSRYGKNFVKTMLRLMHEKESIGVVNDQFGSPTYAADLAKIILDLLSLKDKPAAGIYHYCNQGTISWYDFALEIKKLANSNCVIIPINTAAYPTPAKRPHFSVMSTKKIQDTFNIAIPGWQKSLEKCLFLIK